MNSLSAAGNLGNKKSTAVKALRILAAAVMLVFANVLDISEFISVILSIAAALTAGFDLILNALEAVGKKDFFNRDIIVLFAVIVGFAASCTKEACLLVIMYQFGDILLDYALYRSKREVLRQIASENAYLDAEAISNIVSQSNTANSSSLSKAAPLMDILLKAALVVGILYAVVMPLISDMTFVMSVRRGLMLILAASPAAALISLPLCAETGLAFSSIYGAAIKDAGVLEKISSVTTAVFDKNDVFSEGSPKLSSISSPILDSGTFKALAAYIAYKSQLRIAAPIVAAYKGTVMPHYIEEFNEIPGSGMEISIHGVSLCIMTKDVFDLRGIEIPEAELRGGYTVYMAIAGKYAGRLSFKESINPYAKELVSDLNSYCGIKTLLISEDSESITEEFAAAIGVDGFHYACAGDEKAGVIEDIKEELNPDELLMYISAESGELHSAADIDVRVGNDDDGDVVMTGGFGLPAICSISKRIVKRQKVNLASVLILKLILIILALTGSATMWFIAFADMILASATVLNATRDPRGIVGD